MKTVLDFAKIAIEQKKKGNELEFIKGLSRQEIYELKQIAQDEIQKRKRFAESLNDLSDVIEDLESLTEEFYELAEEVINSV